MGHAFWGLENVLIRKTLAIMGHVFTGLENVLIRKT